MPRIVIAMLIWFGISIIEFAAIGLFKINAPVPELAVLLYLPAFLFFLADISDRLRRPEPEAPAEVPAEVPAQSEAVSIGSTDPNVLRQVVPLDSILASHAKTFTPSDMSKEVVGVDWFVEDCGRSVSFLVRVKDKS